MQCPETTRLLRKVPGLRTTFFSILEAGARLPKHTGVTPGVLSAHLGLKVPDKAQRCPQVPDSSSPRHFYCGLICRARLEF